MKDIEITNNMKIRLLRSHKAENNNWSNPKNVTFTEGTVLVQHGGKNSEGVCWWLLEEDVDKHIPPTYRLKDVHSRHPYDLGVITDAMEVEVLDAGECEDE